MKKRFVVLDGSSLIFRAFYALPPMTSAQGQPTGAILGFSNMLTRLLSDLKPDLMALAFDKSRHTFRTERYADYKGTRDKTPEDLLSQVVLLKDFCAHYGIPFLEKDRYEADDIIGTLATQAAAQGFDVLVVTGDRDALQLIRPNLRVMLTKKGITELAAYDEAAFQEEYGFAPIRLVDLKGLMGDTSDNIPGVPGIGPKTAGKLLVEYGSIESVFAHLEEISGKKLHENLVTYQAQAMLSKELATIEIAVPDMHFEAEAYALHPNAAAMKSFCDRYELHMAWKNFVKSFHVVSEDAMAAEEETLSDAFIAWSERDIARIERETHCAISAVWEGDHPFETMQGVAVAIAAEDGEVGFIARDDTAWVPLMTALSASDSVCLLDFKQYAHAGFSPARLPFDAMLAGYLLSPERGDYTLGQLLHTYAPNVFVQETFQDSAHRAAWEARTLRKLYPLLQRALAKKNLEDLFTKVELPLARVLSALEQRGIYVNREHLEAETERVAAHIHAMEQEIYEAAGREFNVNSPKQLGTVLFEELGLTPLKKTKTGYSTNAEVLESLRTKHPIIEKILAYRLWSKLKSTYLDGSAPLIRVKTGRIHTRFNQTTTATGRLSSSEPNLQNIPVRTEEGRTIRALFEPGEGYDFLLSADYSQIELRILAHLSGDANFIDAFRHDYDVHAHTASEVFGVPMEAVTPELRRKAKAVNFGIVYGISDYGLARDLHISRKEAGNYIARYFARYPGIRSFMDHMVGEAHANGFVTTMLGRRRELPGIKSRNFNQRALAERMAMNTPIQGTAADIIKLAMIEAEKKLHEAGTKSRILLQVHDELLLEVVSDELELVQDILKTAMEHIVKLSVPLTIDIHWGKNWAEAK